MPNEKIVSQASHETFFGKTTVSNALRNAFAVLASRRRCVIRRMIQAVVFGTLATSAATAQQVPSRARVWGAAGVGGGAPTSGGDGITNMVQLVFQKKPHHAAIRALVLHDLDRGTDEIAEVGPLYGRMRERAWGHLTLASGVSAVAFDTCPSDDDTCFAIGLPLVAEAVLSRRFIGLGIQAFGNLNRKASYAGATLFLALGQLR